MTIMEALEKAKLLRQERLKQEAAEEGSGLQRLAPNQDEQTAPRGGSAVPARKPAVHFDPLRVVEISPAECEKNRVLLSDDQLRAFPQVAAAYRLLRSKIQSRGRRDGWSSFAISSPAPGDGKTTTILNVALSIAREKQRMVCVLDLDMRNPNVCRYLGLSDVRPIADFFSGNAGPADVLHQTSVPFLAVAGVLSPVDGASELLAGPRFDELLVHIRDRWPDAVVMLDLPPITVTDETVVVAPRVDAVVIVVSEGKTQRKDLSRALSMLKDYTIAGVIVNRSSEFHLAKYDHYTA